MWSAGCVWVLLETDPPCGPEATSQVSNYSATYYLAISKIPISENPDLMLDFLRLVKWNIFKITYIEMPQAHYELWLWYCIWQTAPQLPRPVNNEHVIETRKRLKRNGWIVLMSSVRLQKRMRWVENICHVMSCSHNAFSLHVFNISYWQLKPS